MSSPRAVLFFLHSPGCPHCRDFYPVWDEVTESLDRDRVQTHSIDLSQGRHQLREFGLSDNIPGVPHLILDHNGKQRAFNGSRNVETIVEFVQRILTRSNAAPSSQCSILCLTASGEEWPECRDYDDEWSQAKVEVAAVSGARCFKIDLARRCIPDKTLERLPLHAHRALRSLNGSYVEVPRLLFVTKERAYASDPLPAEEVRRLAYGVLNEET